MRTADPIECAVRADVRPARKPVEGGHLVFGDLSARSLAELLLHAVAERGVGDGHRRRRRIEVHGHATAFQRWNVPVVCAGVQRIVAQVDVVAVAEAGVVGQVPDVFDLVVPQAQIAQLRQLAERAQVVDLVAVQVEPRQISSPLQAGEIGHAGVPTGQPRQRRQIAFRDRLARFLVERLLQAAAQRLVPNLRLRIALRVEVDRHAAFLQRRNVPGVRIAVERIARQVDVVSFAEAIVRRQVRDVGDAVVSQTHIAERGHPAQRRDVVDVGGAQAYEVEGCQPAKVGDVIERVPAETQLDQ